MSYLNTLALYIGWVWLLFIPTMLFVSGMLWVAITLINKNWKDWRNLRGWQGFREVTDFYREHHNGELPQKMRDMR